MIVNDILGEAREVLGKCDNSVVFKRISDAVRLANNQGKFDIALGHMDICVCNGCVTLPPDVGTILGVNTNGLPTLLRDQWFGYHANGPGSQCYQPWNYTEELGYVTTFKEPAGPSKLVTVVENAADNNKNLRVFGWDADGKRIYTPGPDGTMQDGFLVPMVYGYSVPSSAAPAVARIDRVVRDETVGFVKLIAVNETTLEPETTIGYYQPWETVPLYRRIKVPDRSWIRIKYKKKDIEVRAATDWINIENREALILLLKAVKFRRDNQVAMAREYETEGMRLLSNEAEALRPPAISPPQVIWNDGIPADQRDTLFY